MNAPTMAGVALACLGCAVLGIGGLGLLRWSDVYSRLHAAHAAIVFGAPVALAGLAIASPTWGIALKALGLGALIVALAPTAIQLIGAAAHNAGETAHVGAAADRNEDAH